MPSKLAIILAALLSVATSSLLAQADDFTFYSDLAQNWYEGGDYFEWTSTT